MKLKFVFMLFCVGMMVNSCKKSNETPVITSDISFKINGVEKKLISTSVGKYPLPSGTMVQINAKNGNEDFTLRIYNPSTTALSDGEISYSSDITKTNNILISDKYSNNYTNSNNIAITTNNNEVIAGTFQFFVNNPITQDNTVFTIAEGKFNCKFKP